MLAAPILEPADFFAGDKYLLPIRSPLPLSSTLPNLRQHFGPLQGQRRLVELSVPDDAVLRHMRLKEDALEQLAHDHVQAVPRRREHRQPRVLDLGLAHPLHGLLLLLGCPRGHHLLALLDGPGKWNDAVEEGRSLRQIGRDDTCQQAHARGDPRRRRRRGS